MPDCFVIRYICPFKAVITVLYPRSPWEQRVELCDLPISSLRLFAS